MASPPEEKLKNDIIGSVIAGAIVFTLLHYFNDPTIVLDNIGTFNSTTTTALGLIFTVLAIIYTFESQYEDNKAIRVLKDRGQYQSITEIFVLSVGTIGVIWIYTFALTLLKIHSSYGYTIQAGFALFAIIGFILLIERLRRCFWIFVKLNRARQAHDS